MEYQNIIVERKNHIAYLAINRPTKMNALNQTVLTELAHFIGEVQKDEQIRSVLITGVGEKAFVAGADIAEFQDFDASGGQELARQGQTQVFDAIEQSDKPILAAINGFALGGGLELAMACHIRVACNTAKMGLPEVGLGLIPGYGGTQRLSQLVGKGRAMEMICTGEMISADNALRIGLVNHVVAAEELMVFAESILSKINAKAPLAVASAIRAINASNTERGFDVEIAEFAKCFGTADFKEGVSAFLEKRKANFSGS
jgi:enoyl-CoA hydratase